jgi:hypothetical protein
VQITKDNYAKNNSNTRDPIVINMWREQASMIHEYRTKIEIQNVELNAGRKIIDILTNGEREDNQAPIIVNNLEDMNVFSKELFLWVLLNLLAIRGKPHAPLVFIGNGIGGSFAAMDGSKSNSILKYINEYVWMN